MKVQLKTKAIRENTRNSGTFSRAQANYHRHSIENDFEMRAETDVSDADLLRSMLAGDEEALSVLYRRRHASIYRFACK